MTIEWVQAEPIMVYDIEGRIFVGGLDSNCDEAQLEKSFKMFGDINQISLIRNRETGLSRGFAFISFKDNSSADEAIKRMHGVEIMERCITVKRAVKTGGPGSFREDNGYGSRNMSFTRNFNSSRPGRNGYDQRDGNIRRYRDDYSPRQRDSNYSGDFRSNNRYNNEDSGRIRRSNMSRRDYDYDDEWDDLPSPRDDYRNARQNFRNLERGYDRRRNNYGDAARSRSPMMMARYNRNDDDSPPIRRRGNMSPYNQRYQDNSPPPRRNFRDNSPPLMRRAGGRGAMRDSGAYDNYDDESPPPMRRNMRDMSPGFNGGGGHRRRNMSPGMDRRNMSRMSNSPPPQRGRYNRREFNDSRGGFSSQERSGFRGGGDRMSAENSDSEFGGGDHPRGGSQRGGGGGRFDSSQRSGSMDRSVKRVRRVGGGSGESPEQITPRSSRRF